MWNDCFIYCQLDMTNLFLVLMFVIIKDVNDNTSKSSNDCALVVYVISPFLEWCYWYISIGVGTGGGGAGGAKAPNYCEGGLNPPNFADSVYM